MLEGLNNKKTEVFYLDKKRGVDVSLFLKIARICRINKVDILHCRKNASTFYGGLSRLIWHRPALIADIRGVDFIKRRLITYQGLDMLGLIDRLVVVSEDLKARFLSEGITSVLIARR